MRTAIVAFHSKQQSLLLRRGLLVIILAAQLSLLLNLGIARAFPHSRLVALDVASLLGLDDFAKKMLYQVDQAFNSANNALKADLTLLKEDLNGIINKLDTTYKDLLNVTLNNLDAATQNFATLVARQLDEISTMLNQTLANVQTALHNAIQDFHNQIGQLMAQFEDSASRIVVQVTQSAKYIIDRTAWDAIGAGAVALLLLGLLILPVVIILKKGLPGGFSGIMVVGLVVLFVLVGGLLAFVPEVKAQALKGLNQAHDVPTIPVQPQIWNVVPSPLILGSATEIKINGVHLELNNGTKPVVTINGVNADIHASSDTQIVVAAPTSGNATVQLTLTYNNGTAKVGAPLGLVTITPVPPPALIVISNFHVDPAGPVAGQTIVHAYVTVTNKGGVTSKPFAIRWTPRPAESIGLVASLTLAPNEAKTLTSSAYSYSAGGTISSEVTSDSTEMGSNPAVLSTQVNVRTPTLTPLPPTTTFITGPVLHGSCGATCGQQGDDAINIGDSAGSSCTITSVYLELLQMGVNGWQAIPGKTVPPLAIADAGSPSHFNAQMKNDPTGGHDYTLSVHWGTGPDVGVVYHILYGVQGYDCAKPSNTWH